MAVYWIVKSDLVIESGIEDEKNSNIPANASVFENVREFERELKRLEKEVEVEFEEQFVKPAEERDKKLKQQKNKERKENEKKEKDKEDKLEKRLKDLETEVKRLAKLVEDQRTVRRNNNG